MAYVRGRRERRPLFRRLLRVVLPFAVIAVVVGWLTVGPAPEITIEPELPGLGPATPVLVTLEEPRRGVGSFQVELEHEGGVDVLARESRQARPWWTPWAPRTVRHEVNLTVGKEMVPELQEGEATLRVVAQRAGTWLRTPEASVTELTLPVRLTPPRLAVARGPSAVRAGGSAVVVYRVGEQAATHGVRVGERFFPGYPLPGADPGSSSQRFCLFALSWDAESAEEVWLEVADELGNQTRTSLLDTVVAAPPKDDDIRVPDSFLERVVPKILERTPEIEAGENLLASYLLLNNELRAANAATLAALAKETAPEFLWKGPFRQLPDSQVMAGFAERRTYLYDGEAVDRQVHLGYDLASVRQAPVPAANAGRVVFADYLGIYGYTVVVDHGHGLMTLYSHLSSIAVDAGQSVETMQTLGRTGITGLAGGDHLHFSVLVHGVFVNPLEWWDPRWVERSILRPLEDASP
ncbi:MAG: M23 family metallopeptidase [Acidobacteriota bacterium]